MTAKNLLTALAIAFSSFSVFAQAPANSLGGYANVDNNLNKIPRVFFGINGVVDKFQGIGLRTGAQLKIRGDRFGEFQLNATFTPSFLVTEPKKPFGPTYRCDCAENNMNPFTEIDGSYTYYLSQKESTKNYHILLNTQPNAKVWPPSVSLGETDDLPGKKRHYWGVRAGAAYQNGNLYLLSQKRMLAYSSFDQLVGYAGFSHTSMGRMFKNFDGYGIKGKNVYHQFYIDAFYAFNQAFEVTPISIYDSKGTLLKEDAKGIPYGGRIGFTHYHFGFRSNWAWYVGAEAGVRPTFDNMANGVYASLKFGVGIGTSKTPVYYVTNRESRMFDRAPNARGNGKYRSRKGIDKKTHKYKPLKLIPHRYGK